MFVLPVAALLLVLVVLPTIQATFFSFTDWDGVSWDFVGLQNYASSLVSGPSAQRILINNLVLIVSVPIAVFFEYCVAYALWAGTRGAATLRIIYFLPVAVSWAVVGIIFRTFLLQFAPTMLSNSTLALVVVVMSFHWALFGLNTLIIFAGLNSMDRSITEAATMDGAGQVRIMLSIVAPMARSFIDFALITTLILSLTNIFGLIYAFDFGGPGVATTTLEFKLYQDGFTNGNFGLAAATGIVLMLVTVLVSLVSFLPTVRRLDS